MREFLRGGFVIGRRDFSATVLSRAFILFLMAPLFPLLIAGVFGGLTAQTADQVARPTVAFIGDEADFTALLSSRERLQHAFPEERFVQLMPVAPADDPAALRERLLKSTNPPILAVLEGGLERPEVRGLIGSDGPTARQLQLLIETARDIRSKPMPGLKLEVARTGRSAVAVANARALSARVAQGVLFILTMLLTTMMLSQMIEEKSNKIIEVLAAAVPVDSIFLGKLLAMLAASLVGLAVWAGAAVLGISLFTDHGLVRLPTPATGWPAFIILGVLYFSTSYLLLGSIFLGIGAHASTAREVQVISMPITMAQVLIFALSAIAVGDQGSPGAIAVAAFPLSSPYVMFARAAEMPGIWPHLVALAWQLIWVIVFLKIASRLFRRSVLKSGPSRASKRKPARA